MGKFWHKLKDNKKVETPKNFIFYDTETTSKYIDERTQLAKLRLGVAVYRELKKNGNDYRVEKVFETSNEFWDFVFSKCYPKTTLYLFSHNQNFDFNVVEGFKHLEQNGWKCIFIVCEPSTFIAKFRKQNVSIVVLDTFNYFKVPLEQLGKDLGLPKLKVNFKKVSREALIQYCRRDVEIVENIMLKFIDFLKKHDLGNFRYTIASQSLQAFKHRFNLFQIIIHANEKATELARKSYHGGRIIARYLGKMPLQNYYKLDINSGYPDVMYHFLYPTKLKFFKKKGTLKLIQVALARKDCVIAHVKISTKIDAFPVRKHKVIFPVGSFECYLTTRELEFILSHPELCKILQVFEVAVYEAKPIFRSYVQFFYGLKLKYEEEGNQTFRQFAKYFLNTLSGKWGQQNEKIREVTLSKPTKSGYEVVWDIDQAKKRRFFTFASRTIEILSEKEEAPDSFPEISAHITADQRITMSNIELLLNQNGFEVYYMDTDSIFVTQKAYQFLSQEPFRIYDGRLESFTGKNMGQLKVELRCRKLVIHGAKDYIFGKEVKLKGIKKNAKKLNEYEYQQWHFPTAKRVLKDQGLIIIRRVTKKLKRNYDKGRVIPVYEGYSIVEPYVLEE